MTAISTLTIDMLLNTSSIVPAFKRVQTEVSATRSTVESLGQSVEAAKRSFDLLGVGLSVAGIAAFAKEALGAAAATDEMAHRAGLSAEQFQGLQYAALQSGLSIDAIDTSVARLTRSIGEAAAGNRKAIDSFNQLHIGVLDANGAIRPTADILLAVAKSLAAIAEPARRAAAETALLGRGGQQLDELLVALGQGRITLDQFAESATKAGFAFSDDLIEKSKQATAQIEIMKREFEVLGTEAYSALQPIADVLNQIIARQKKLSSSPLFNLLKGGAVPGSSNPIQRPLTDAQLAANGGFAPPSGPSIVAQGGGGAGLFNLDGGSHNPPSTAAVDKINAVINALKLQLAATQQTDTEQKIYADLARAGVTANSAAGQQIAALVTEIEKQRDATTAVKAIEQERVATLTQQDDALANSFKVQQQMADAAAQRQADIKTEIGDNAELIAALGKSTHAYQVQVEIIRERNAAMQGGGIFDADQARANAEALTAQAEKMAQITAASNALSDAVNRVGESFLAAATGTETWKQFALDAISAVAHAIEKMLTTSASGGSGGGGGILGSLLGAIFSGFSIGGTGGVDAKGPHTFATGGDVSAGVPVTVGEHGEETFIPSMDGTILPHSFTGTAAGGSGVNIVNNYDFRGSSVSQADVERAVEKGNRKTYSAVFSAMSRGGPESKASGRRQHK